MINIDKIDLLKVAFSILKEISENNYPTAGDYGITPKQFVSLLEDLEDKNYIKGITIIESDGGEICKASLSCTRVTLDGLQFLHDNSKLMKTYKGLKEARDWIPFVF